VDLLLSPMQFMLRIRSGPLVREIDRAFAVETRRGGGRSNSRDVIDWLDRVNAVLSDEASDNSRPWRRCFASAFGPLLHYLVPPPIQLISRVFIAVRVRSGTWVQLYADGTPMAPPKLMRSPCEF